ncbi:MAG: YkgJ family cysteine cluster protein [Nitrospirae bacterium]|nr:YkgJ family cysteine cluster protein [Nitrospirota bacterium]
MNTYKTASSELKAFWDALTGISHYIKCNSCSRCCDLDNIYLFPFEKDFYENQGIRTVEIDGMDFFRKKSSWCPYLSKNGCSIYEYRPIGCRLFPLEVIYRDEKLYWMRFSAEHCMKNLNPDISQRNVTQYFIVRQLTSMLKPYSDFIIRRNNIEKIIDIYKSEHLNYHKIKEF